MSLEATSYDIRKREEEEHMKEKPDAADFYGQAILLQHTIREFAFETTPNICREHTRLVCLAINSIAAQVDLLVAAMAASIEKDQP